MHLWFLFAAKHPYSLLYRISSSKPVRLHDHQWWIDVELVVPPDWPAEVQSCFQGRVWGTWGLIKTPAIKNGASFLIPCLLVASCIIIPVRFSKIAVVWIAASMLFGYLQDDLRIPFERGWNLSDGPCEILSPNYQGLWFLEPWHYWQVPVILIINHFPVLHFQYH